MKKFQKLFIGLRNRLHFLLVLALFLFSLSCPESHVCSLESYSISLDPYEITIEAGSSGNIQVTHHLEYKGDCVDFKVDEVRISGSNTTGFTLAGCFEYNYFPPGTCELTIDVPPGTTPRDYHLGLVATSSTGNDYHRLTTDAILLLTVTNN